MEEQKKEEGKSIVSRTATDCRGFGQGNALTRKLWGGSCARAPEGQLAPNAADDFYVAIQNKKLQVNAWLKKKL